MRMRGGSPRRASQRRSAASTLARVLDAHAERCARHRPARPAASIVLTRDRHRDDLARQPDEIAQKAAASLFASMPTIRTSGRGTRSSRSASARRRRGRHRDCGRRRARARCPAAQGRPARPRPDAASAPAIRPRRAGLEAPHCAIFKPSMRAAPRSRARHCRTDAGRQPRRRQIEQAALVLIDQPAALFADVPVLAGDMQRRAQRFACASITAIASGCCSRADHRHAALDDAGLLGGDLASACRREIPCGRCRPA